MLTDRLLRAGASPEEAGQVQAEYDADPKTALLERLDSMADQDIREWLDKLREGGHFLGEHTIEADGIEKTGIEVPADGTMTTVALTGRDEDKAQLAAGQ